MIVVSDTSPIRYLILIDAVHVLPKLFGSVLIPPIVASELQHPRTPEAVRSWIANAPAWLSIEAPATGDSTLDLDSGERQAILLAGEKAAPLLIDDEKGRIAAELRHIHTFGTLAVLMAASEQDLLDFPRAIKGLTEKTNFRTPTTLVRVLLARDAARRSKQ